MGCYVGELLRNEPSGSPGWIITFYCRPIFIGFVMIARGSFTQLGLLRGLPIRGFSGFDLRGDALHVFAVAFLRLPRLQATVEMDIEAIEINQRAVAALERLDLAGLQQSIQRRLAHCGGLACLRNSAEPPGWRRRLTHDSTHARGVQHQNVELLVVSWRQRK